MNKPTKSNLFISPSLVSTYHQLVAGIEDYTELGLRIMERIKAAHAFRQVDTVRELARLLINLPIKEYRLIASYYLVWCQCRESVFDKDTLEEVIELSRTYKAKALLFRGSFEICDGEYEKALFFYSESLKANPGVSDLLLALKSIAVIKSLEGFRESAIKDLASLVPLLKHADPFVHYDVLNSYAVVLKDSNRWEDAGKVARVVVSSPFGPYYQEWRETLAKIDQRAKKRSTVYVHVRERHEIEIDDAIDAELAQMFDSEFLPGVPQPFHGDVADAIDCVAELGPRVLLAVILKLVLRNRITDKEVHLICDMFYAE